MARPEGILAITLKGGRTLAYREYGDPDGVPCIYTTGTPASSRLGETMDGAAKEMGVRWISLDKPGYGYSTFQPGRQLLDWPADIAQLADHLGLQRFAVAGESGGGPHALALAHELSQRITTTIVLAGAGPADDPTVLENMLGVNKVLFAFARRAPWALRVPMSPMSWALSDPRRGKKFMTLLARTVAETDREAFLHPAMIEALAEAVREGPRGYIQEFRIIASPWGFRIKDITAHVDLFHGEQDRNVPVAVARAIAAELPDCTARIRAEYGHAVSLHIPAEVLQCVLDAA